MPEGGWQYMMLDLNMPDTHVILRKILENIPAEGDQTVWKDTPEFDIHQYPFTNFPIIHSHVHPCLVSLNAWEKLRKFAAYPAHWEPEQVFCARLVVDNVELWFEEDVPIGFKPDPRVTAEMRRLRVNQQPRLMETTPPPEAVGLFAMAAEEAEDEEAEDEEAEDEEAADEEAPGSDYSTPTKKRAAPSRPIAGRPGKRARNAKAGTSETR